MLTKFGQKTKSVFLNNPEAHKLNLAFEVATGAEGAVLTVKRGQPVKLNNDGLIVPAATDGTDSKRIIGYCVMNGKSGDEVTVAVKGYATIFAMSSAAVTAGPVQYTGINSTDDTYTNYANAASASNAFPTMNGWSLDPADGANELIRVVLI